MLNQAEWQQVVVDWNQTATNYPRHLCVHELFEQQVSRRPDATALVFEKQELSYRQLNERANQLAHHLIELGVGPEVIVGVALERSLELIISLLAILKAGGAYVPLDPSYPRERLKMMAEECSTKIIISVSRLQESLPQGERKLCLLDHIMVALEHYPKTTPVTAVMPMNLAYVIYTSGSTGRPKGVAVLHRGITRLVLNTNYVVLTRDDVFLQIASVSFDAATFEIWGALLNGAKLYVFSHYLPGLKELGNFICEHQVTVMWLTAAFFNQMVDSDVESLASVRQMITGGEVVSVLHVSKFLNAIHPGGVLINGYGPTENTTFSCCYRMDGRSKVSDHVPIGSPISNTQVYILDQQMQPVAIHTIGEIYLGGEGLARGYINRPDLTAELFLANPFSQDPTAKIYKTGDLGFWNPDGTVSFAGRVDDQIKLRGIRIEPAEIEEALLHVSGISQAVVICREDVPGNQQLVAYCILESGRSLPTAHELRLSLARTLPEAIIPTAFVALEKFPLTSNGKVNRRALPLPHDDANRVPLTWMPKSLLEQRLIELWQKVLGRQNIGVHDNFFDLGGHSLAAAVVVNEVEKLLGQRLPIAILFLSPTVYELATYLKQSSDDPAWSSIVPLQPAGDQLPIFVMHGLGGAYL
jgi:aspartate racemase